MTIQNTPRVVGVFDGDGTATQFPFNFKVCLRNVVKVFLSNDGGQSEEELRLGSDYEVLYNADQDNTPGGAVTLLSPLAVGQRLAVVSSLDVDQQVTLTNNGAFYPETLNAVHDRAVALVQEVRVDADRALKVPFTSALTPEEMAQDFIEKWHETVTRADEAKASAGRAETSATTAGEFAGIATEANERTTVLLQNAEAVNAQTDGLKRDAQQIRDAIATSVTANQALEESIGQSATDVAQASASVTAKAKEVEANAQLASAKAKEANSASATAKMAKDKAEVAQEAASVASDSAAASRDDAKRSCECAKAAMWQAHEDVEEAKLQVKKAQDAVKEVKKVADDATQKADELVTLVDEKTTEFNTSVTNATTEVNAIVNTAKGAFDATLADARTAAQSAKTQAGLAQASATGAKADATRASASATKAGTAEANAKEAERLAVVAQRKAEAAADGAVSGQVQADWTQTNPSSKSFIHNKPDLSTLATKQELADIALTPGPKGDKGDAGPRGPKGDKGDAGVTGPKGATGDTGPRGPVGPQGPKGADGARGPAGADGATGATGARGPQGPQGPQGPKGADGARGPKGDTGPQGPAGLPPVEAFSVLEAEEGGNTFVLSKRKSDIVVLCPQEVDAVKIDVTPRVDGPLINIHDVRDGAPIEVVTVLIGGGFPNAGISFVRPSYPRKVVIPESLKDLAFGGDPAADVLLFNVITSEFRSYVTVINADSRSPQ